MPRPERLNAHAQITQPGRGVRAQVSAGFIHTCLARAAGAIADVTARIRALIKAAHVAGFDETTLRAGPAGTSKYVLGAFTERYSAFFLGQRSLESFREFGILPGFQGVVVSDRYACYFHDGCVAGNQACPAHLIRDYQDAAECWPAAIWPGQAQRALRGLIKAWHQACEQGLAEIPGHIRDRLIKEFKHAVLAGLSDIPRIPGPRHSTAQHPGRDLLEFCHRRQDDVLRFTRDTRIWPTNDLASHCTSWGCRAVFGWSGRRLGWLADVILACGGDILGGSRAAGDAVRVAAA